MRKNLIQPAGACVPCKEELCQQKVMAMVNTGHSLTVADRWAPASLLAWVDLLDRFAAEAEALLMAGPIAGQDSLAAGAEDWRGWFNEAVAHFLAFVAELPAGERDEALRAGRDSLSSTGAEIGARGRGFASAEAEHAATARGEALGGGAVGSAAVGG